MASYLISARTTTARAGGGRHPLIWKKKFSIIRRVSITLGSASDRSDRKHLRAADFTPPDGHEVQENVN